MFDKSLVGFDPWQNAAASKPSFETMSLHCRLGAPLGRCTILDKEGAKSDPDPREWNADASV